MISKKGVDSNPLKKIVDVNNNINNMSTATREKTQRNNHSGSCSFLSSNESNDLIESEISYKTFTYNEALEKIPVILKSFPVTLEEIKKSFDWKNSIKGALVFSLLVHNLDGEIRREVSLFFPFFFFISILLLFFLRKICVYMCLYLFFFFYFIFIFFENFS
jgi:hypothetical protein